MNRYLLYQKQPDTLSKYLNRDSYPENQAVEAWLDDSNPDKVCVFCIKYNSKLGGFYCGYVRVYTQIKPELIETIKKEVIVHGGITYSKIDKDSFVVGFDCGHWGYEKDAKLKDLKWLKKHCEELGGDTLRVISQNSEKNEKS